MPPIAINPADLPWTKEGFAATALRTPPAQPPRISQDRFLSLSADERAAYDEARANWHERFEMLDKIPTVARNLDRLRRLVTMQPGTRGSKSGLWIDGESTMGKTTQAQFVAREVFLSATARGTRCVRPNGNEFVPVLWIDLPARPTLRAVNMSMCEFLNMPRLDTDIPRGRSIEAASWELARVAAAWAISCGVRLVVIDDAHALHNRFADAEHTGMHIRCLMTLIPAVFVLIGTDLRKNTPLLNEGAQLNRIRSQSARRFGYMPVRRFPYITDEDRAEWNTLLRSLEKRVVTIGDPRGTLSSHADLVYDKTKGSIGSLIALVRTAAGTAIDSGEERILPEFLDDADTDYASEFWSGL